MYAGRSAVELYQDTYLWTCTNVRNTCAGARARAGVHDRLLDLYLAGLGGGAMQ